MAQFFCVLLEMPCFICSHMTYQNLEGRKESCSQAVICHCWEKSTWKLFSFYLPLSLLRALKRVLVFWWGLSYRVALSRLRADLCLSARSCCCLFSIVRNKFNPLSESEYRCSTRNPCPFSITGKNTLLFLSMVVLKDQIVIVWGSQVKCFYSYFIVLWNSN